MGIFSRFERGMEDGLEGAAGKLFSAPITPVQISKKAERAMHREKMVGAGKQYAPTLYTVLVNAQDDSRLFGYYPTLAGETETYLSAKAAEEGFLMDGQPLVRFIVDEGLRRGKFDIVAELVSAPIIAQLRQEEMRRYGLATGRPRQAQPVQQAPATQPRPAYSEPQLSHAYEEDESVARPDIEPAPAGPAPLPYVPEDEIDRSIDYGEYTFNSQDWESYQEHGLAAQPLTDDQDPQPEVEPAASVRNARPEPVYTATRPQGARDSLDLLPEIEADLSGLDVDSYDPVQVDSRDLPESQDQDDIPYDEPTMSTPNTNVFAAGSQSHAVPNQNAVEARLLNSAGTHSIDLASHRLIMGRSSSCDIVIDDINASRNHAELRCEDDGEWVISDLGSTNGTLVNGRRITSRTLYEGDRIRIGTNDFIFTLK